MDIQVPKIQLGLFVMNDQDTTDESSIDTGEAAKNNASGPPKRSSKAASKGSALNGVKTATKKTAKSALEKKATSKRDEDADEKRTRTKRPYPASAFFQVTKLGEAIHKWAA